MSNKQNDIYAENLWDKLQDLGGTMYQGETLEEAVQREGTSLGLFGMNRSQVACLLRGRLSENGEKLMNSILTVNDEDTKEE